MSNLQGSINTKINLSGELFKMGTKGYSAYEVAVQQGFKGTVDEWLQTLTGPQGPQGPMGPSNIYVGDEEPTDKNINVWFDTNEEADLSRLEKTLQDILTIIQGGELSENQVADIEELIVSYFENKSVKEVEE